jgi:hypothetical protein
MPIDNDDRPDRWYDRGAEPSPAKRSGLSPVAIVLIVVGGLCLVGVLACGGVMYLGYRRATEERMAAEAMMREADLAERVRAEEKAREEASDKAVSQRFAEAFVKTLQENREPDAYQQISPAYRAKTTEPQFAERIRPVVEKLAEPIHRNPIVDPVDRWGPAAGERFEYKLVWTAGYEVTFTVAKVQAGWLVDALGVRKE